MMPSMDAPDQSRVHETMNPIEPEVFDDVKQQQFSGGGQGIECNRKILGNRNSIRHLHDQKERQVIGSQREEVAPENRTVLNRPRRMKPFGGTKQQRDAPKQ